MKMLCATDQRSVPALKLIDGVLYTFRWTSRAIASCLFSLSSTLADKTVDILQVPIVQYSRAPLILPSFPPFSPLPNPTLPARSRPLLGQTRHLSRDEMSTLHVVLWGNDTDGTTFTYILYTTPIHTHTETLQRQRRVESQKKKKRQQQQHISLKDANQRHPRSTCSRSRKGHCPLFLPFGN